MWTWHQKVTQPLPRLHGTAPDWTFNIGQQDKNSKQMLEQFNLI